MKRFESLDAFRGICALIVVARHLHIVGAFTEIAFFRNCDILIEFFFVLSGFVLAHNYAYKEIKFIPYMTARFFRIFPIHVFMLFILIALECCKLLIHKFSGIEFDTLPFTGRTSPSEALPNLFLIQSWTPWTDSLSFNYPSWSLSVEFYIYILLYLTINVFRKLNISPIVWVSISIVSLWLLFSGNNALLKEQDIARGVSCFFGGAFIYSIFKALPDIKISTLVASTLESICLALIVFFLAYQGESKNMICTFLFFIAVFIFAYEKGVISLYLKDKYIQHLGRISCSIYLTHAAIILTITMATYILQKNMNANFMPMIAGRRYLDFSSPLINNMIVLIIMLLVVTISTITHNKIEVSFMKYKHRYLRK
ncbi:acyltransferase [Xenorhabdus mauleonii]|uniref:Acyltransferase n=1 Tax=Xenorhabdus mauleonii TaxID=351675 RepID=A0A1I3IFD5_9GAMM|nr:acyltransferase [Xenorhabdus mauleonii]PHM39482.1 acyltransferase [Xenorhabdus mauleonii]SFI46755.1 Peptidoglycan/LPS O-acetylase OafA/YrhL, contains acyltransferase and SGNH-hydrolase domains [Xenorhabdus mauleonii]